MKKLSEKIIKCRDCPRLVSFREKIAVEKRKLFRNQEYWGKAVPGFGDIDAEILILGLAPAAHGANRTGRVFTGDRSAEFLFKCLYAANFSNQKNSESIDDNLKVYNTFITLALKCVPPNDKPTSEELKKCFNFFEKEIKMLKKVKIILALGKIAFDTCVTFFKLKRKDYVFKHAKSYKINEKIKIVGCYHPSPRNVNTKKINHNEMVRLLKSLGWKTTSRFIHDVALKY